MRRKTSYIIPIIAILATLLASLFAPKPDEAQALEAFISKVKSDCSSIQLGITLIHRFEDNDEGQDRFRLLIYEREAWHVPDTGRLALIDEGIVAEQSPFYWVTSRIETSTFRGRYTIEIWDLNDAGDPVEMLDQVHYECGTEVSWRGSDVEGPGSVNTLDPQPNNQNQLAPPYNCTARMPLYTTNTAPESGTVIITWSGGPDRSYEEYHWITMEVDEGAYFTGEITDNNIFSVPCGTYIRVYFQPDSTKLVYQMPSQYWPNSSYGVGQVPNEDLATYHTVFPLNGPPRTDPLAPPTPSPRPATATPVPEETETPTPEA